MNPTWRRLARHRIGRWRTPSSSRVTRLGVVASISSLLIGGCALLPGHTGPDPAIAAPVRDCLTFLDELDRLADTTSVRDGGEFRVPGFPYLRVDRFTASFRQQAAADPAGSGAVYPAWVERMRQLDAQARRIETANLPADAFPVLRQSGRGEIGARVDSCGRLLVAEHASQPPMRAALVERAVVPDDYSVTRRALGLYPLTGIGFAASVRNWQQHARQVFAAQRRSPQSGQLAFQRYAPPDAPASAAAALVAARAVLAASPPDVLGVPQIPADGLERLFNAYAPTFEIATAADADRIGTLQWIDLKGLVMAGSDPHWLDVDTTQPVVYRRLAFTRQGRSVLVQLVYSVWFGERPMQEIGDLYSGRIDGLVWRVTLDEQGEPLIYDSIQPSGRFAMFFPTGRVLAKPVPADEPLGEWAYSPIDQPIERWVGASAVAGLALHVSSQNHQVVGIGLPGAAWGEPIGQNPPYRMIDADRLRMLPLPGGGHRSIYDAHGVVPGSERLGRYFFWPMGIANAGAMRQWGRQPTALIGRRHFDDADLLERRFERLP